MKELYLKLKEKPTIPIEAENVSPDIVAGKQLPEVRKLSVFIGNTKKLLGDFFDIEGEVAAQAEDQAILVEGDLSRVKYIGAKMTAGKVVVNGDVGMHLGAQMTGGEIQVNGSAGDWTGVEMKGGLLRISGDAGYHLGSVYRGSAEGMTGGCIVVDGNAGQEVGSFLRRGMIVIRGNVGPFAGVHMNGGEIFIFGRAAKRLGADAKGNGGIIVCLGEVEAMLPTYIYDSTYKPTFMKLYMRELNDRLGVKEAERFIEAPFRRYHGDTAIGGNSEIFIAAV